MKKIVLIILSLAILVSCKANQEPDIIYKDKITEVEKEIVKIPEPFGTLIAKDPAGANADITIIYERDEITGRDGYSVTDDNKDNDYVGKAGNIKIGNTWHLANWYIEPIYFPNMTWYSAKVNFQNQTNTTLIVEKAAGGQGLGSGSASSLVTWVTQPTKEVTYILDFKNGTMIDKVNKRFYFIEKVN